MAGTQWVRLDAGYFTNPKVLRAGRDGMLLHLAGICYLGLHERDDGVLSPEALAVIARDALVSKPCAIAGRLVAAGLWHEGEGGAYLVHDYGATNGGQSSAAAARERQRRYRERHRKPEGNGQ